MYPRSDLQEPHPQLRKIRKFRQEILEKDTFVTLDPRAPGSRHPIPLDPLSLQEASPPGQHESPTPPSDPASTSAESPRRRRPGPARRPI